jgi:hypothetical protein
MFGGWGKPNPEVNASWYALMQERAKSSMKFFSFRFADYIHSSGIFADEDVKFLLFNKPKYQVDQKQDINLDLSQPMDDGYTGIITFCLPLAHHFGIK